MKHEVNQSISKLLLFIFCICCCLILYAQDKSSAEYNDPKEKLHVYLLIGQSNMAGRSPFTEKESGFIDRTYLLNNKNQWVKARNPFNRYSTILKSTKYQKMNPGYTFSIKMLEANKDISIGLVVNARGGTRIKQWTNESCYYREAVRRTKIALKTGELQGVLWHQGESDFEDAEYLEKLKRLIKDLRSDFGMPNLPFVAGQIHNVPLINDQIATLPDTVSSSGFVSSKGLQVMEMERYHFDTKSMKILGQRYAEEMLKINLKQKAEQKDLRVFISKPSYDYHFSKDELPLTFKGSAMFFNSNLSDKIKWTSDKDGELGVGREIIVPLSIGTHKITAYAENGDIHGSYDILVTIQEDDIVMVKDIDGAVFKVNRTKQVITDTSTSLMWERMPVCQRFTYEQAISYAKHAELAGYTNWRLPNIQEAVDIHNIYNDGREPILQNEFISFRGKFWSQTSVESPSVTYKYFIKQHHFPGTDRDYLLSKKGTNVISSKKYYVRLVRNAR